MGFLGVRIDQELEEKIKNTGRSRSEVVRDALRAYFEVDRSKLSKDQEALVREIERLLDEKILALNTVKQDPSGAVKRKQALFNTVKQPSGQPDQDQELIKKAAKAILDCFDEGREPLIGEIAEGLGLSSGSLGMYLKPAGIKAKPTGRQGVKGRYFTFDLRERVEEVLCTRGG